MLKHQYGDDTGIYFELGVYKFAQDFLKGIEVLIDAVDIEPEHERMSNEERNGRMEEMVERDAIKLLKDAINEIYCGGCEALHELNGDKDSSEDSCRGRHCNNCHERALVKAAEFVEGRIRHLELRAMPDGVEWPRFDHIEPDKEHALKPLEEASEVYGAWQAMTSAELVHGGDCVLARLWRERALEECADVILATLNLVAALGVEDFRPYLMACERRNRNSGRITDGKVVDE